MMTHERATQGSYPAGVQRYFPGPQSYFVGRGHDRLRSTDLRALFRHWRESKAMAILSNGSHH